MVNHGLDVEFHAVLEAVHWLVDGCDEGRDGTDVVPGLNYLVEEAGMPPDTQVGVCLCVCLVNSGFGYQRYFATDELPLAVY